jgi:glyceraldehyde 3-phosphate dehydrogenase
VHSYTATQKTVDGLAQDWRGGRSAAIPSSTTVSSRFPRSKESSREWRFVPTVSVVDLTVRTVVYNLRRDEKASETYLPRCPYYTGDEVFSMTSSMTPLQHLRRGSGIQMSNRFFKLVSWYDNEWGYSERCVDLIRYIASRQRPCLESGFSYPSGR